MPRLISVTSGCDGAGRTSFVLNAGIALAKMDFKVLLVDADMGISNLDVMLGIMPEQTIEDFVSGDAQPRDIILKTEYRIDLMPASSGLRVIENPVEERMSCLSSEMASFTKGYDFIIVDSPSGTSPRTLNFLTDLQELILCISPDDRSLTAAYALIKELRAIGTKARFSMLSSIVKDYSAGHEIFRKLSLVSQRFVNASINYIGPVVMDEISIPSAVEQVPLIVRYPTSDTARCYRMIASTILSQKAIDVRMDVFFERLIRLTADDSNPKEAREINYDDKIGNAGMERTIDAILEEQRKTRLLLERLISLIDMGKGTEKTNEM